MIYVKDGDTIAIIAKTGPSATDPEGLIMGASKCYRVVASANPTLLELIPLGEALPISVFELASRKDCPWDIPCGFISVERQIK